MRDLFPGYYRPTEEKFQELWKSGAFVFDTNVLLSLYSYPDDVRNVFLSVLKKISDRIWIPYQVALEFHRNKFPRIKQGNQRVQKLLETIKSSEAELTREVQEVELEKRSIGISDLPQRVAAVKDAHQKLLEAVQAACSKLPSPSLDDPIGDGLAELLKGRVGNAPKNQDALEELLRDANDRYEKKIPPGFLDANKSTETYRDKGIDYSRKYGDLVLWKQLIAHAKETGLKQVIFVTSEKKEDWWRLEGHNVIGPLPELVHEILEFGGVEIFWMYSADQFLRYAENYLQADEVTEDAIEQVREVAAAQQNTKTLAELFEDTHEWPLDVDSDEQRRKQLWGEQSTARFRKNRDLLHQAAQVEPRSSFHTIAIEKWILQKHPECAMEVTFDFPDYVIRDGENSYGYVIKQVSNLRSGLESQWFAKELQLGSSLLSEGVFKQLTVVVCGSYEEVAKLLLSPAKKHVFLTRLRPILNAFPITSISVGAIVGPSYAELLNIPGNG